jgi:hypothetical protein
LSIDAGIAGLRHPDRRDLLNWIIPSNRWEKNEETGAEKTYKKSKQVFGGGV